MSEQKNKRGSTPSQDVPQNLQKSVSQVVKSITGWWWWASASFLLKNRRMGVLPVLRRSTRITTNLCNGLARNETKQWGCLQLRDVRRRLLKTSDWVWDRSSLPFLPRSCFHMESGIHPAWSLALSPASLVFCGSRSSADSGKGSARRAMIMLRSGIITQYIFWRGWLS